MRTLRFRGRRSTDMAATLKITFSIIMWSILTRAQQEETYEPLVRSTPVWTTGYRHTYVYHKEARYLPPLDSAFFQKRRATCSSCPLVYLPVCTNKRETFINVCYFKCMKANDDDYKANKTWIERRGTCIGF